MGKKHNLKKKSILEKNQFSELLGGNLGNVLDNELKQSLQNLKDELEYTKTEKDKLIHELTSRKEEIKRKDTELEILKTTSVQTTTKIQFETSGSSENIAHMQENERSKFQDEIRKLKQELSEKEGNLDILNLKVDELTKSNKDLVNINEGLNEQLIKRKEKLDSEMNSLYTQIKELEIKKSEFNNSAYNSNIGGNNNKNNININSDFENEAKRQISEVKQDNKILAKKYEDIKSKYEKELSSLKNEISSKDSKLSEIEIQISKKEKLVMQLQTKIQEILGENTNYRNEIDITNIKLNNLVLNSNVKQDNLNEYELELNKNKRENENIVKRKDQELNDLRDALETIKGNNERLKKMENALKNELTIKDNELGKRQEILKEINKENEKISDENLSLKKENYNLQSKLQILEIDYKNKNELELQLKNKELKSLKENVQKYEKYITELKESINKKKEIIANKKEMNIILCDLAKVKKAEVQCLETLQYANTENIRKTLEKIRHNEKELLDKYKIIFYI